MDTLVLDGKNYLKASRAAEMAGYTSDYVGQLCRSGSIDAHLVGRSWYVNFDQLSSHRVVKKRMSRVKAREQVRKAVEEHKRSLVVQSEPSDRSRPVKNYEKRGISYERDEADLIPQVKKLEVKEETCKQKVLKEKSHPQKKQHAQEPNYVVENEGSEVKMTGKLEVVDVTDEAFAGKDTVVMTPRIVKTKPKNASRKSKDDELQQSEDIESKTDFLAKLAQLEAEQEQSEKFEIVSTDKKLEDKPQAANVKVEENSVSLLQSRNRLASAASLTVVSIILTLVVLSVFAQSNWTYRHEDNKPPVLSTDISLTSKYVLKSTEK